MIYGYPLKKVNEYGLLEMREICFELPPDVLREVGQFLVQMAEMMESGEFSISHRHIQNVVNNWNNRFPNKDIVVSLPDDWCPSQ